MLRIPVLPLILLTAGGADALAGQNHAPNERSAQVASDTFLDAKARDLVLRALELRDSATAGLRSYEATATERTHIGLSITRRVPLRARTLYHREQVARVYWDRGGDHTVRWIGRRVGSPTMGNAWATRAPFGLDFDIVEELDLDGIGIDIPFDPTGDRMDFFQADFVQPVSPTGIGRYYFESGDTMQIRPGSANRTITLVEVKVRPRESTWELVEGSLWFDRDTGVLVRAAYRPSDVWDQEIQEPGDFDDVPGFLKPAIGTVHSIVVEYGLFEQRWWLPYRVLGEAHFDWGNGLVRMPMTVEWTMSDHTVNEEPGATVAAGAELVRVGLERITDNGRVERIVHLQAAGVDLARAKELPPPLSDAAMFAFTQEELEPLLSRMEAVAGPTASPPPSPLTRALVKSLRYDRVGGLSAGYRQGFDVGTVRITPDVRLATAIPDLFATVEIRRNALRLEAYRRLDDASDWNFAEGLGNTFATFMFGHDGGEYYRAAGTSLSVGTGSEKLRASVEGFLEQQRAIARHANVSLATLGGGTLRPNVAAERVDLMGARFELAGQHGADVQSFVLNWRLHGEAARGDAEYGRAAVNLRFTGSITDRVSTALDLAAGMAGNGAPVQRNFFLGGVATLRGVRENSVNGPAFWLSRLEVGTGLPGMRAIVFADAGWAGERTGFRESKPVAGAGLGASFMDGLFRLDLARGVVRSDAFRLYFYLDALL